MAGFDDVKAQIQAIKAEKQAEVLQVSFDLEAFTAGNVNAFLAANRFNDMNKITASMIPFFLSIPKEWGDMKEALTYEKLPMVVWKQLVEHVAQIINLMTSKN